MNGRAQRYVPLVAVALWAVLCVLLLPLAGRVSTVESNDPSLALPANAEATRALDRARAAFPGTDTPVAVVVYVRDGGITAQDSAAVAADRVAFGALANGGTVAAPIASADGRALLLSFPIAGDSGQASAVVHRIRDRLSATAPAGLRTAITGSAGLAADASEAFGGFEVTLVLAGAAVVAVLLLVMYRSPVLWMVPLVAVVLASQIATAVVYLLGRYAGVTVTPTAVGITVVMVYGVGTDYALLLIARYREELRRHADRRTAMVHAWRRSLPAILAAAGTVVAAMLCLLAARMNTVRGLGPVAAVGITVTFAVMTTLLPALLVLLGRWVFWPRIPRYTSVFGTDPVAQHGFWRRIAQAVGRRPRTVWVVTALGLVLLTLGVSALRLGQPASELYTKEYGSVLGQGLIAAHFPSGASAPVQLVGPAGSVRDMVARAGTVDGVATVRAAGVSADGRWALVEAVLVDPADSAAAERTVDRLRDAVHPVPDVLVGGATAIALDSQRAENRDDRVLMPLVLGVVFVVLVVLLRAVVAPVVLVASVVLSFGAAWGAAGLVLRAIGYPHIDQSLPVWSYIFLVPLGVDYTIFLMTRAREEVLRRGNRDGVLTALTVTGGVITSAGVVLAATFGTLVVLPLVAVLQIGVVVAIGVLLDTVVVRTLLVPALAVDIGRRIWWPGRIPDQPRQPRHREAFDLAA